VELNPVNPVNPAALQSSQSVPLLSLLLPLHRPRLDHLEQLLASLPLDQPEVELVVGINPLAAEPATPLGPWLEQWRQGARWQVLEHDRPLGVNAHFQALQRRAQGSWLAPVDQDDRWQPGRWQSLVSQLLDPQQQRLCLLLVSPLRPCNDQLRPLASFVGPPSLGPLLRTPPPLRWLRALMKNHATGCCCIYSRPLLQRLGWPPAQPATPYYDHQLLLQALVSRHCAVGPLAGPGLDWRRHQGCVSGVRRPWRQVLADRFRLLAALVPRQGRG